MSAQAACDPWHQTIMTHLPHRSKTLARVLAWGSLGMVLARDATTLGDRVVVLAVSVLNHGGAMTPILAFPPPAIAKASPREIPETSSYCTSTRQIPIALARSPLAAFARPFVVAWRQPRPCRQARGRAKATHVHTDLGDEIMRRDLADARNTVELFELWCHRTQKFLELLINLGYLTT